MSVQEVAGAALMLFGTLLIVGAGLGMVRLRDVYNRVNAVAKAATLGVTGVLAGVLVLRPSVATVVTVILAIAAQLFTAPISGYAVARAADRSGAPLMPTTDPDELAERYGR